MLREVHLSIKYLVDNYSVICFSCLGDSCTLKQEKQKKIQKIKLGAICIKSIVNNRPNSCMSQLQYTSSSSWYHPHIMSVTSLGYN